MNSSKLHIGIVGYCNPSELSCFFPKGTKLPNIHNNAVSVTTYVKELAHSEHELSIFTSFTGKGVQYQEFHCGKIHIYVLSRRHKVRPLGLLSRYYIGSRYAKVIAKHINDIDVLHAQWTYDSALALIPFAKDIPCFCTVRDWCPYIMTLAKGWQNKIYWWASYQSFKKVIADKSIHFIANSQYTYERIKSAVPDAEINIIPNPIYKDVVIESNNECKIPSFIAIASCIDDPRKNNMVLIKAFYEICKEHPNANLIMIGAYSKENEIYKYAKEKGLLNNVLFIGSVSHNDIFKHIDKSHCLVHTALEETFGNILLEAMARRVLCIGGKNSGAVPQVLDYGKCGILCDIERVDSVLEAMKMSLSIENRQVLIDNASRKISEQYRSDVNMKKTVDIYEKYLRLL